jgi:two-component system, cell cycle response regulator DivK
VKGCKSCVAHSNTQDNKSQGRSAATEGQCGSCGSAVLARLVQFVVTRSETERKEPAVSKAPLVLVVDDAADNREAYAEYLRFKGFQILEAATGSAAIDAARRYSPDVVLLDLRLPDVDGLEVSRRLRSSRETQQTKIIAVSACVFPDDVAGALASGCDAFLQKPCLPDVLVAEMERLLVGSTLVARGETLGQR